MPAKVSGRCVVTGVAGFIGSHLAERLVADGCEVVGVDCLTDYYDPALKEQNLAGLVDGPRFELVRNDLASADLSHLLDGADHVFHQAGQPGVRRSWGQSFEPYVTRNILATQRLLEASLSASGLRRFVNASSSSVYGEAPELPVSELALPRPVSPYGVTKLAAEHLATLYARLGVPTVSLRYFTVYGPRQRPDMAFNVFLHALLDGRPILVNGDGEQTRDFTFIADAVEANVAAAAAPLERVSGRTYNVGGGSRVTVSHTLRLLEEITGKRANVEHGPAQPGDARDTYADTSAAQSDLGWAPAWTLADGLRAEAAWLAAAAPRVR
jgi:nucleoside-diphosphate-sugar epimerase